MFEGEVVDPLREVDFTSLRNSSHGVMQLLPCETAKTGPPALLLFRGVGTAASCVPVGGGTPSTPRLEHKAAGASSVSVKTEQATGCS